MPGANTTGQPGAQPAKKPVEIGFGVSAEVAAQQDEIGLLRADLGVESGGLLRAEVIAVVDVGEEQRRLSRPGRGGRRLAIRRISQPLGKQFSRPAAPSAAEPTPAVSTDATKFRREMKGEGFSAIRME